MGSSSRLYRPQDRGHAALAGSDNQRYAAVRRAGVLSCATQEDVAAALRWCARHAVPFAPRSGGHNYAGFSTTSGLVISVRPIRQVEARGRRLHLGGGATNSDMHAARDAGLYFPGGRCAGVGVAGLTLGGGLGFNDRKWGLTCDHPAETQVVLSDGTVVRASGRENTDLFWACRGGAGGNFGINTAFVFDAVPVDRLRATVFDLSFDLPAGVRVMDEVREILDAHRADDFDLRIGFKNAGDGTASLALLASGWAPRTRCAGSCDRCCAWARPGRSLRNGASGVRRTTSWRARSRAATPPSP
ncbi:FAD-binding oxidoreductase [Streptomyces sp. NPDC001903]|uniref:FAD-binding oxidoreductase n=1 Tax=Streptomyces sp. NPDC001903 TaxID=3364622 RepID=UPI00369461D0